jgi:hypothetical protein
MAISDLTSKALDKARQYAERGSAELHYLQKMISSGAFGLEPPQNFVALAADVRRWGEIGMIPALNARRNPHRTAIIDDEGTMTFAELNNAVNATAKGGDPGPQSPLVPDRQLCLRPGRRTHHPAQHRVLRPADPRRRRA